MLTSSRFTLVLVCVCAAFAGPVRAQGNLVIHELMYHPVELPAFDTNGAPLLDLSDDVHEFVELHNLGPEPVNLDGWRLTGGIAFAFPSGRTIAVGGFVVVAKDPVRLAAIPEYGLTTNQLLGPYAGQLGNDGDTVRLRNARDEVVDSVSYAASFPWAIGADALGAEDEWTGLNSSNFQYRGRSLERVSGQHPANDPANWLASPLATGPTPGRANSVILPEPLPVVVAFTVVQANNGSPVIRSNQPVRLEVRFSAFSPLSSVSVECFADDISVTNEPRSTLALAPVGAPGEARFTVNLPGRADRSVVRYRIRADRGHGIEVVSPRADDPLAWQAYFISPQRASANPIYECFISATSLNTLATNIAQAPRRVTTPDPPGWPRVSWNATEPAMVVISNEVVDVRMRHHGSRYRRDPGRSSYKWLFPRYHRFAGRENIFITDKSEEHRAGHGIFAAAGLPTSRVRSVDLYLNSNPLLVRLEQEEMDDALAARWAEERAALDPGAPREAVGEFYKSQGVVPSEVGEGPYGIGNCQLLDPRPPYWTELNRYEWTYSLQMHGWKGHRALQDLLHGLWAARGDSVLAPNPDVPALRTFLEAHFDVDATLTYMALRNWNAPFDNATHNYFLWRRADGRWGMLPWDFDNEFINSGQSIYWDEQTNPQPDTLRGPQWVKDSFFKTFREEFRQKLFLLNNTLLHPTNLSALGFGAIRGFADARFANVNQQLGLGVFQRPTQPVNLGPANNAGVLPPATLASSAYVHSDSNRPAHASTTWLIRGANGTYRAPVLRLTSTTNLTSLPIPFDSLTFGERYFWKCAYTDTNGHPSLDSVETSFVFGGSAVPGAVALSEILADNRGRVRNGTTSPDFIELRNLTGVPQDLSQMSLSDSPERPGKFSFPAGTTIAPKDFLVVWCDDATNAPGLHAGFALDNDGQTVALFAVTTNGFQLADVVTFGLQVADQSIGRSEGSTRWALTEPTPGTTNVAAALAPPASLKVNEWMASSSTGPDWFELYNPASWPVELAGLYLTDSPANLTNTRIPALSFIAAGGFRRFLADQDLAQGARHVDFRLSASGDAILMVDTNLVVIDTVTFLPQTADVSEGRLLDGSTNRVFFPGSASPEAPNFLPLAGVVISEVLTHSVPPLQDVIELQNLGVAPVDLSGWWLSDRLDALRKFRIPTNTVLPPGGFVVFDESQFGDTNSSTAFALNGARGDEVFLSAGDAAGHLTGFRTGIGFGAAEADISLGRVPTTGGVDFWPLAARTWAGTNAGPRVGPVVISEIAYHPPALPGDNDLYEYVELANLNASPVDLFDPAEPSRVWRLRDAVAYSFPPLVSLAPGERVLVVPFDPATNAAALSNFLAVYAPPPAVRLFGPYAGKLDNAGDSVELLQPGTPVTVPGPDFGYVPTLLVDRVRYSDHSPWPVGADGTGASLQRVSLAAYGNEPTNWFASGVTPGTENASNTPPTVTLLAPADGTVISYRDAITLTATAADGDGFVRLVEFFADDVKIGQASIPPFTVTWSNAPVGAHTLVAIAGDDRLGFAASAPVVVVVTNQPPVVALVSPANGAAFLLPTNLVLEAVAEDADGAVTKVEFLVDGVRLGEDRSPPYSLVWTNPRSGARSLSARATDTLGATATSEPVMVTNSRLAYVAYLVPPGEVGSQDYNGGLGMDFDVLAPILVTRLGVFDSGSDGINASSTLTAQLFRRSGNSGTALATLPFSATDPGALVDGSRFKPLALPLVLPVGSYTMVSYGHNANNRNGNIGTGNLKTWTTDDGGGLLTFVGSGRHGGSPGVFPATPDGGPADRYAAGTFEYLPAPTRPLILAQPTNQAVRLGQNASFSVSAAGQDPFFFQWLFEGVPLPGRTNTTLPVTNVQASAEGAYSVLVSNALGSILSAAARLVVLFDPIIVQQPLGRTVVAGETVTFSVAVTNNATLPIHYRWRRNGANFAGNSLLSIERLCFLTVTNIQLPFTNYTVVVSNAARASLVSSNAYLTFLADADADGLPDAWETAFGFSVNNPADAGLDADGDTLSNGAEYLAGTDPTDASSCLRISRWGLEGGVGLEFQAVSNRTYTVEYSEAPGEQPWRKLADVLARPTNRLESVLDPAPPSPRFYRLATPAQP